MPWIHGKPDRRRCPARPNPLSLPSLLHPQRAARLSGEELPDELVVRVEQFRGRSGFDDPSLPEDCDVLGYAARGHDVVGDHDIRASVLLVDLLDELAEERG